MNEPTIYYRMMSEDEYDNLAAVALEAVSNAINGHNDFNIVDGVTVIAISETGRIHVHVPWYDHTAHDVVQISRRGIQYTHTIELLND